MPPAKRSTVKGPSADKGTNKERTKLKGVGGKPLAESPPPSFRDKTGTTPRKMLLSQRGGKEKVTRDGSLSSRVSSRPLVIVEVDEGAPTAVSARDIAGVGVDAAALAEAREARVKAEARHAMEQAEMQRLLDDARRQLSAASLPVMFEPVQVKITPQIISQAAPQSTSAASAMIAAELSSARLEMAKLKDALTLKEGVLRDANKRLASHEEELTRAVAAVSAHTLTDPCL